MELTQNEFGRDNSPTEAADRSNKIVPAEHSNTLEPSNTKDEAGSTVAPRRPDGVMVSPQYLLALEHTRQQYEELACGLERLDVGFKAGHTWSPIVQTAMFQPIKALALQMRKNFAEGLQALPPLEEPSPQALIVLEKVFGVTELMEGILLHLDLKDLLVVQKVNKTMRATVANSKTLRIRAFQLPDPTAHYATIANTIPCPFIIQRTVQMSIRRDTSGKPHCDLIIVVRDPKRLVNLKLGSATRSLMVCQPPVSDIVVTTECCNAQDFIFCDHLSLGHLQDLVAEQYKQHIVCHAADPSMLDEDGNVNVQVTLRGNVFLREDDPVVEHYAAADKERWLLGLRTAEKNIKFRAYTTAKRAAYAAGLPTPTFAEFKQASAGGLFKKPRLGQKKRHGSF